MNEHMTGDHSISNYLQKRVELQEKQFENETALTTLKHQVEMLHEVDLQGKKVFEYLSSKWASDSEITRTLRTSRIEYDDHLRQIRQQLATEKEVLLKHKRSLIDEEEELHHLKHAVEQGETK